MPFIDEHKLLFVHIPKCGGTSIEEKFKIVKEHDEKTAYSWYTRKFGDRFFAPQHYTPKILKSLYPERFKSYKKFTVVRNPYTKCISSFFYQTKPEYCNEQHFKRNFHFWCEKHYIVNKIDLPQAAYFEDVTYDYVLHQETLNRDFMKMARELNIDGYLPFFNKNKSKTPTESYIQLIEPCTIDFINTFFKKDFELLKYPMIPGIITGK